MKREETSLSSLTRRESSEAKRVPTVVRLVVVEVEEVRAAAAAEVAASEGRTDEAAARRMSTLATEHRNTFHPQRQSLNDCRQWQ